VRTLPGRPPEPSWLYIPADPVLRDHAASVEHDLRSALRAPGDAGYDEELERAQRDQSERSGELPFEPLSADVAPQLTLFGPLAARSGASLPPRALDWPTPNVNWPLPGGPGRAAAQGNREETGAPDLPAFERRALLRDERHRLVSEVRRRDRLSHREINAWLNRKLGIASVEQATLEDLERSVQLLVGRLGGVR
jgi:hypothetical protein